MEMWSCRLSSIVNRQDSRAMHDTDSLSQQRQAQRETGNDRKSHFPALACVQDGLTHCVCLALLVLVNLLKGYSPKKKTAHRIKKMHFHLFLFDSTVVLGVVTFRHNGQCYL